ncbi:MAG: ABC-2 transporter permease [Lachnospira sp.]|nr:ABC-2 transporter permease [Lachnospira sp.]
MVGQLYKDIKIAWQAFLFLGFIFAAQIIVTIEAYQNPQAELASLLFMGTAILNFFAPFVAILPVIQADESEKWISYTAILPGGIKTYVQGKYMFMLLAILATGIISHIYSCIISVYCKEIMTVYAVFTEQLYPKLSLKPMDIIIVISSSLGLLLCSPLIPLLFRFGTRTASSVVGFLFFPLLIGGYVYWMFGDISFFMQDNFMEHLMQWMLAHRKGIVTGIRILPILGIIGTIVSYLLVVKKRLIQPRW